MLRMCFMIMEETYDECNAALWQCWKDREKEKKVLNRGRPLKSAHLFSLAGTWNIVYAYVRKVSCTVAMPARSENNLTSIIVQHVANTIPVIKKCSCHGEVL